MNAPDAVDKEIEDSLRAAIRLNPRFAPAYDRLATFYGERNENLDEAHLLNIQAIQLDPDVIVYRLNGANILVAMDRIDDALRVLNAAAKIAKNPREAAMVQSRIDGLEGQDRARTEAEQNGPVGVLPSGPAGAQTSEVVTVLHDRPKHPTEPATGPRHSVTGVIRGVVCSYPSELEFRVDLDRQNSVALYNNDFRKIELTVIGFTPKGDMNPCADFEGLKARVQYVQTADKTVNGQVVAVELMK
jgi:tetratricopeptide (TPR) repeat protein